MIMQAKLEKAQVFIGHWYKLGILTFDALLEKDLNASKLCHSPSISIIQLSLTAGPSTGLCIPSSLAVGL